MAVLTRRVGYGPSRVAGPGPLGTRKVPNVTPASQGHLRGGRHPSTATGCSDLACSSMGIVMTSAKAATVFALGPNGKPTGQAVFYFQPVANGTMSGVDLVQSNTVQVTTGERLVRAAGVPSCLRTRSEITCRSSPPRAPKSVVSPAAPAAEEEVHQGNPLLVVFPHPQAAEDSTDRWRSAWPSESAWAFRSSRLAERHHWPSSQASGTSLSTRRLKEGRRMHRTGALRLSKKRLDRTEEVRPSPEGSLGSCQRSTRCRWTPHSGPSTCSLSRRGNGSSRSVSCTRPDSPDTDRPKDRRSARCPPSNPLACSQDR